jgi:hypothetical protein
MIGTDEDFAVCSSIDAETGHLRTETRVKREVTFVTVAGTTRQIDIHSTHMSL